LEHLLVSQLANLIVLPVRKPIINSYYGNMQLQKSAAVTVVTVVMVPDHCDRMKKVSTAVKLANLRYQVVA
jgi:hypothetical protein